MRRLPGQVARASGRVLHRLAHVALLALILIAVAAGGLAWRLSQGPLSLPWAARWIENAANADGGPTRLKIGAAALEWEGFKMGVDRPLAVRLTDVTATDPGGTRLLDIPSAQVSFSIRELLLGNLRPRAVELRGVRLRLLRAADGSVVLDLGSLGESSSPAPAPSEAGEQGCRSRSCLGSSGVPPKTTTRSVALRVSASSDAFGFAIPRRPSSTGRSARRGASWCGTAISGASRKAACGARRTRRLRWATTEEPP